MSKHMKRLTSPRSWVVRRKDATWSTKPRAGPHSIEMSIPLSTAIRDYLGYADTQREARHIIGSAKILVDGKPVRDHKRPVGLMDVVSIPETKENFRMLFDKNGKLRLIKIDAKNAEWKLARIENKTTVKGGKIQLNLHDGRNILLSDNKYETGDVLKIALPSQEILDSYKLGKGNLAMVIGGAHLGNVSTIVSYEVTQTVRDNPVVFKDGFSTGKKNVFVLGKTTPEVKLPEVKVA
ncbi:MAG: 30S ribosomal protein S4e [Candidatus Thermoplasmatota archaeon]|nr:30S ribosomal protein S4e [Candidatus Thermoplasmatota archaeon]